MTGKNNIYKIIYNSNIQSIYTLMSENRRREEHIFVISWLSNEGKHARVVE